MNQSLTPLRAIPHTHGDLISSSIRTEGVTPWAKHIAVFEYPDCTREYDGERWKVTADKRQQQ